MMSFRALSASLPAPSLPTTAARGAYGERVAAAFLRPQGYRVLYRNFRTERGEIDQRRAVMDRL